MQPPRDEQVRLAMPEGAEDRARHFYGRLLGLTELDAPHAAARHGVWFQCGPLQLHLGARTGTPVVHAALPVSDLQALAARLVEAGCEVQLDDDLPGLQRALTHDPFGNRIELLECELDG